MEALAAFAFALPLMARISAVIAPRIVGIPAAKAAISAAFIVIASP